MVFRNKGIGNKKGEVEAMILVTKENPMRTLDDIGFAIPTLPVHVREDPNDPHSSLRTLSTEEIMERCVDVPYESMKNTTADIAIKINQLILISASVSS